VRKDPNAYYDTSCLTDKCKSILAVKHAKWVKNYNEKIKGKTNPEWGVMKNNKVDYIIWCKDWYEHHKSELPSFDDVLEAIYLDYYDIPMYHLSFHLNCDELDEEIVTGVRIAFKQEG